MYQNELYPAFCRQHGLPRRTGFPLALSDSQCLRVELAGQYLGYIDTLPPLKDKLLLGFLFLYDDGFGGFIPYLRIR